MKTIRVLLLDDQPGSRKHLGALLSHPSVEKIEANDVDGVIAWTRDIDLAIVRATFDEDATAPEGGVNLSNLRRLLDTFDAPFVVLTDATAGGLSVVRLSQAHYLFTFAAPLHVPRLSRVLEGLLTTLRRASGRIADESLDDLLREVVTREESGVLVVSRGVETRRVVFDRARIVFCGVERADHEEDLFEGYDCGDEPSARAAWDAVMEIYLWGEGEWAWFGARVPADPPCALPILLDPLRKEGQRRQQEWRLLRAELPPPDARLAVRRDRFPAGFPSGDRDRMLVERAATGTTVEALRAAWGRQEFLVCRRLVDLIRLGLIEVEGVTLRRQTLEERGLAPRRSARLVKKPEDSLRGDLSAAGAFVVSRLSNGELFVEEVLTMCPLPVDEVLAALMRLVDAGIVQVRELRGEDEGMVGPGGGSGSLTRPGPLTRV